MANRLGTNDPIYDASRLNTINLASNLGASPVDAITELTGDVTAIGPGSVPATLATVNANVGTFGSATQVSQATVNAKGLITAISNVTISGVSPSAHDILSVYHGDTLTASVVRGDVIVGNATPKWSRLALGGITGSVLTRTATDVGWSAGALSFGGAFTLTISGNSTINGSLVGNITGGGTLATGGFTLTVPATGTAALLATANVFTVTQQITVATATAEALILKSSDNSLTKNVLEIQNSSAQKLLTINLTPVVNLLSLDAEMRVGLAASTLTSIGIGRRLNFRDMLISRNLAGVSGADTYKTILTDGTGGGYSAVSLQFGGNIIFYGASGNTTADAVVAPVPLLTVLATKAVGVNTGSPNGNLEVQGTTTAGIVTISNSDTGITSGESIGQIDFRTYDPSGSGAGTVAQMSALATTDYAGASKQTDLILSTGSAAGTVAETFRVLGVGGATISGKSTAAGISQLLGLTALGSGADGDGGYIAMAGKSSTTAAQSMAALKWSWATATHASRKGRITSSVYDTAERQWLQVDTDGSVPTVWFLGRIQHPGTFAAIHCHDASTTQNVATGVTYAKITAFTDNGYSSNCTPDAANDKITITKAGYYKVIGSVSFSDDTNNVTWFASVFLNGTEQDQVHFTRKIGTAGDVGNAALTGIIDVTTVPWDVDLRMRHDAGGTIAITVSYANINVEYIGET